MVKLRARCLLLGDAAVGKSALAQMFTSDGAHFHKNYSMTTGVELLTKSVNVPETSDSVWGQPSVVCVLFDLTSQQSFDSCPQWMERVQTHCGRMQVPAVLQRDKPAAVMPAAVIIT
ncbi:hypothetical protein CRUP_004939 [Coryphaenoides rupestris]|nr:hypothetical protein CRUP_004939 [Coryphaenoides rupestris]